MNHIQSHNLLLVFAAALSLVISGCSSFWASTAPPAKPADSAKASASASGDDEAEAESKAETEGETSADETKNKEIGRAHV